jgi:hypothetical protein
MATNVVYDKRSAVQVELTVGASKSSGDVVVLNDMPVFLLEDSDSSNLATVQLIGCGLVVDLSVVAEDGLGNSAVAVGDAIYQDGSAYNKDSINGFKIGYALEAITSGSTSTIQVALVLDTNKLDFLALGGVAPSANALFLGIGASATRATTATADKNAVEIRAETTATSGDNRGIYNRYYIGGAGAGGESLRSFTTVEDVAASTAHGAHISLNFNDTGSVTGLGVATRATLHIPNDASWAPGTIAALQAEIYSDGDDSDTDGATEVSFIRVVNDGNASGIADVDDDADLLALSGFTIGAGNMVQTETDETKFSHKIRCNVGGTTLYLMACAT